MQFIQEKSLWTFEAWSGAKLTLETLTKNGDVDSVEEMLEEYFETIEKIPTETEINDILWLETDWIAEYLGYEDWETYNRLKNEQK